MKAFSNEKNITTTFCFKLLGCKFIRINPDAENYDISVQTGKIWISVDQSNKEKLEKEKEVEIKETKEKLEKEKEAEINKNKKKKLKVKMTNKVLREKSHCVVC